MAEKTKAKSPDPDGINSPRLCLRRWFQYQASMMGCDRGVWTGWRGVSFIVAHGVEDEIFPHTKKKFAATSPYGGQSARSLTEG